MKTFQWFSPHVAVLGSLLCAASGGGVEFLLAQGVSAAPATAGRQIGTVQAIAGSTLTIATASGATVQVTIADTAKVQQLAPGSTDLKTAQPASAADISVGDRILALGAAGDTGFTAARLVLMKASAIAQSNASRQADWQRRGAGGIVTAIDAQAKSIALTSGRRKITLETTPGTIFRRYAAGSVKFEEATPSTLTEMRAGDQLRVRGAKSADALTITAEEIVFGSFRNLAGTVVSVDASSNLFSLKDLATKKTVKVVLTRESDMRSLPPEMAAHFAARLRGGASAAGAHPAERPSGAPGGTPASPAEGAGRPPHADANGTAGTGDLSQVIERLPAQTISDLKPGEALMIVGSDASSEVSSPGTVTAITVLSGVELLLAAAPQGGQGLNLSPWSLGGGESGGSESPQ